MSTLRAVYANLQAARTTIRDVKRFQQIATVLVRHGFGFLFSRFSKKDPEVARAVERALVEPVTDAGDGRGPLGAEAARRAREAIEELGPTFIKFGQILSTRPDLVPEAFCAELQGLQDDVEPMSYEHVQQVIEEELGGLPRDVFAEFEEEPIAAASVAQVHRARLKSGEAVAVKVQRPGIGDTIDADLDILYFLARQLVDVVPETRLFDPPGIVREFEKAIRRELDFASEARNIQKFQRNFADVEYIHIPEVYLDHSTVRVITMEFIRGVKVTDAVAEKRVEGPVVARRMLQALFKQLFKDGFFHGDLHPGNILVLENGDVCYLDFGLVGRLTPERKDRVVDLLFAVGRQDFDALARVLFEMGEREAPVDYDAFVADTYEIAERYFQDTPLAEVDVGQLFKELVEGAMRHQMRMPTDYTMVTKALMTVEGLGKQIAPEMDVVKEAQPFISELLRDRYSPERVFKRASESLHAVNRLLRQVPPTLTRLLEDMDAGRLTLQVQDPRLDDVLRDKARSDSMWGLGLGYTVLMVCATLALGYDARTILGFPALSFLGYALAVPVGALFLRAWWRR